MSSKQSNIVSSGNFLPASTYPAIVGQILADERKRAGLSQADLARRMHMNQSGWSKIERGTSALTVSQLAAAAAVLDTTPGELLHRADRSKKYAEERGIRVEARKSGDDLVTAGLVLIGAAALAAIIAAALSDDR